MTSVKTPLEIEGVKDEDGPNKPTGQPINIEGQKVVKEEGTALAAHTTAPEFLECPTVNTCCKCGPTLTCNTARCECRKSESTCVSCRCLRQCTNITPHTQHGKQHMMQAQPKEQKGVGKGRGRRG